MSEVANSNSGVSPGQTHSIEVTRARDIDIKSWNDFVDGHEAAGFCHRFEWGNLVAEQFGHTPVFLLAKENLETVGVFPIVQLRSALLKPALCSMPFVDFGGPVATTKRVEQYLLEYAKSYAAGKGITNFQIRTIGELSGDWPSLQHKVLFTVDLRPGAEELWSHFKSKHRTAIRRATKNDLEYISGRAELIDDFYSVLSESWHRLGSPLYPKSFFTALLDAFDDDIRICVVRHKDKPVAVAMNGESRTRVDGMWLGMTPEGRRCCANYVLYWEMIREACADRRLVFSLGRSSADSSAESFKKKWNASLRQLYWSYPLLVDKKLPRQPRDSALISLASQLWRSCPRVITDKVGPLLAKHFP